MNDWLCVYIARAALEKLPLSAQLACSLRDTLTSIDRAGSSLPPLHFLALLRSSFPQFAQRASSGGYMQQDAEEFFNVVAQSLSSGLAAANDDLNKYLGLEMEEQLVCEESELESVVVRKEMLNKLVCNIQVLSSRSTRFLAA